MLNRNQHISTNIHQAKNNKGSMVQRYILSTKWERHIVGILRIYGDRAIFHYFVFTKTPNLSNVK